MLALAALFTFVVSAVVAQPIPAPSGSQLIMQRGSCLGVMTPGTPAQMLPCTSGNVEWEATQVPDSSSYKLRNVQFGCYAVREENTNFFLCEDEDRASALTIEQAADDRSMIVHGDQTSRVALHATPGPDVGPLYFGSHTPEEKSLFSFVPVQDQ